MDCCESEHRKIVLAGSTLMWSTVQTHSVAMARNCCQAPCPPRKRKGRDDEEARHRLALGIPTRGWADVHYRKSPNPFVAYSTCWSFIIKGIFMVEAKWCSGCYVFPISVNGGLWFDSA